ncbi:hypothetical protein [Geotalea uraniireducens]|nr:hypothetical protein [Geotalea uraniireducens]
MNLIVISNKKYPTDFRKYLMAAAELQSAVAIHIYAWEEFVVTFQGHEICRLPGAGNEKVVYEMVRKLSNGPSIVLTGLGGRLSKLAISAKRYLSNCHFIYDIYDHFQYGAHGVDYWRWRWNDLRWRYHVDSSIVLSADLMQLYPGAYHLNNASHLTPPIQKAPIDPERIVYLGSIDERVDWEWLKGVVANGIHLDIYGQVHLAKAHIEANLASLLHNNPQVKFYGRYDNNDLPEILSQYTVGIIPYAVNSPLTHYVNPDKLYHFLNCGLEVVAPGFPQALRLSRYLHLLNNPQEWNNCVQGLCNSPKAGEWRHQDYTWERRWQELVEIVRLETA